MKFLFALAPTAIGICLVGLGVGFSVALGVAALGQCLIASWTQKSQRFVHAAAGIAVIGAGMLVTRYVLAPSLPADDDSTKVLLAAMPLLVHGFHVIAGMTFSLAAAWSFSEPPVASEPHQ
jgi:hypothetical protein